MPQDLRSSLWLVPQPADTGVLQCMICKLAQEHGGTPFAPHLTLLAGLSAPRQALVDRAALLAAALDPITLRPLSVDGEQSRFRCLYIRFAHSRQLDSARCRAESVMPPSVGAFLPHMSLYYGRLETAERLQLARAIILHLPAAITLDRLAVADTSKAVEDWDEIAVFRLGSWSGRDRR